jgi:hypothetical protein
MKRRPRYKCPCVVGVVGRKMRWERERREEEEDGGEIEILVMVLRMTFVLQSNLKWKARQGKTKAMNEMGWDEMR